MSIFELIWQYLGIPKEMVPLVATSLTVLATLTTWFISWLSKSRRDLKLQYRGNYLKLELESSRIFTVALERPEIPRYLRGETSAEEIGTHLQESTYWFVCQVLNIFEIAVSFRREEQITNDLFATWVSWFHELGTSKRFGEYWIDLRTHYTFELREILDKAQERLAKRPANFDQLDENAKKRLISTELGDFHEDVAGILDDPGILAHYQRAVVTRARP